ncbi:hypothetical protein ARMSODRAFT_1090905 [Armillaria solidipes]|uniref:Uncharacterized protein n=1 Tax=Armillaria solidipes TaxID=1076256 RepID=A0A2H3AND5_9AGAR|nr:hypothetical protein ARMSODRAFT_1090905 [Armillaria solidipes]
MPSQEVTLPSFDELLHSLNGQNPPPLFGSRVQPSASPTPPPVNNHHPEPLPGNRVQPNAEPAPPPIITVNHHGHQKIPGPLGPEHQWLKQALGVVHENRPLGHGYPVPKPSETWPPPHEKHDCSDFGRCSFLSRWSPFPRTYVDPLKNQGKSYTVYLHRPKWDERTSLPVLKSILFISNDPGDQELGLPGVSVTRLLAMEPGILADSDSVVLNVWA